MDRSAYEPFELARPFLPLDAEAWRKAAAKVAGEGGLERLIRRTLDGIAIEPLYAPPLGNAEADRAPRGGWPSPWTIAQPHAHPDPATANRHLREDLANGADTVVVRVDQALARGTDTPDGVLVYDAAALSRLLQDIPGQAVLLEAGARARELAAFAPAATAAIAADPVGAALEGLRIDPERELDSLVSLVREDARIRLIADGRPWHAAGASEVQELTAALACWLFYLRALESANLALEEAARRIELVLAVDDDLFLSLAKIRAGRLLAERILKAGGIDDPALVRIRAETGERMLAKLDPWVNILRTTVAGFAAVAGGADALSVVPFDRPLQQPSLLARRLARNLQLILRDEVGMARVRDPAAGSWYVAHLTRALAEEVFARLRRVEEEGGWLRALVSAGPQEEVARTREKRAQLLAIRVLELTGVSAFPILEERAPPPPDPVDLEPALARARAAARSLERAGPASFAIEPLPRRRLAEPFERLRARAEEAARARGTRPTIPVVALGRPSELHELLTWVENLLAVGGIATERLASDADIAAIARARAFRCAIVSIGASGVEKAREVVTALRAAGVDRLWLAGTVPDDIGPSERLVPGLDVLAFHDKLHGELGIAGANGEDRG